MGEDITVVLHLEAPGEGIAGRLDVAPGVSRPFAGWLQLIDELSALTAGRDGQPPDWPGDSRSGM